MKTSIDPNRIPGPGILAIGLFTAFTTHDHTVLALSICTASSGLLLAVDDLHEQDLRRDRKVIAHLAKQPDGARPYQICLALNLSKGTVAKSLTRLLDDGIVVRVYEGKPVPLVSYRLAD
ncbi:MarR family transcriptional regulator [Kitasatospora sp. NPDC057198]|uniref:MarR family transcriptional regulator n=1 Tax=Kitasatospora sp. NPDC057198 TaxID=3346046 RepID=UPI0036370924